MEANCRRRAVKTSGARIVRCGTAVLLFAGLGATALTATADVAGAVAHPSQIPVRWIGPHGQTNPTADCGHWFTTTAPANASSVAFSISGGGGGAYTYNRRGAGGGSGSLVTAPLDGVAGDTFFLDIGCGGGGNTNVTDHGQIPGAAGYAPGGHSGNERGTGPGSPTGGAGGGASGLCLGSPSCRSLPIVVAGGGGASSGFATCVVGSHQGYGGRGGGGIITRTSNLVVQSGSSGGNSGEPDRGGGGGRVVRGGGGGDGGGGSGEAGSNGGHPYPGAGGFGGSAMRGLLQSGGGGGGGGYSGGGGGGGDYCILTGTRAGGGGGGSSMANLSYSTGATFASGASGGYGSTPSGQPGYILPARWNLAAPFVTSVGPDAGPIAGGTPVAITGAHLASSTTQVTFDGFKGAITSKTPSRIVVTTPAVPRAGTVDVVVATDAGTAKARDAFTYYSPVKVATTTLPDATYGTPYSAALAATGGGKPYTWSMTSGSLPTGLSLDPATGVISGTPTGTPGMSTTVFKVTDNYNQTDSAPVSITVAAAHTTTTVTADPSTSSYGDPVSFTARVSGPGGVGPSGTVTFRHGSDTLCSDTLLAGKASCRASDAPVGGDQVVTGTYSGDALHASSEGTTSITVHPATSVTAAHAVPDVTTWGTSVVYSAQVANAAGGSGYALPTGTVAFTTGPASDTTALCTATLVSGSASCQADNAPVDAAGTVIATYGGDGNYHGSSGTTPLDVSQAPTTTTPSVTPETVTYGDDATYQATVAGVGVAFKGRGSVRFTIGSIHLCTADLDAAGSASCVSNQAPILLGLQVTATFSGNTNFAPSSGNAPFTVTRATTTTTPKATPSTAVHGSPVTFSAVVISSTTGAPTGSVAFTIGKTTLCTATLAAGSGSCVASNAPVGAHQLVTAVYSGSLTFPGSTGTTVVNVQAAPTATTASVTPASTVYGSRVTYSARVTSTGATPTGAVTFAIGSTALCTATLGAGSGSCTATDAPVGSNQRVSARYTGDPRFLVSVGTTVLTVTAGATGCSSSGEGAASFPSGYWLAGANGAVYSCGDAPFYGSLVTLGVTRNRPIVGMASTPDGKGYWLVASDGGVFAFGDAAFYGSMGGHHLNEPVVGISATSEGGYDEVAADGGIFTFGPGATFHGSMGGHPLNRPVVGMAVNARGGYLEVASDGGIFTFGPGATFHGSMGGQTLNRPVVGMTLTRRVATTRWPPTAASSPSARGPPSTAPWEVSLSMSRWWGWPPPREEATTRWPPTGASSPSAGHRLPVPSAAGDHRYCRHGQSVAPGSRLGLSDRGPAARPRPPLSASRDSVLQRRGLEAESMGSRIGRQRAGHSEPGVDALDPGGRGSDGGAEQSDDRTGPCSDRLGQHRGHPVVKEVGTDLGRRRHRGAGDDITWPGAEIAGHQCGRHRREVGRQGVVGGHLVHSRPEGVATEHSEAHRRLGLPQHALQVGVFGEGIGERHTPLGNSVHGGRLERKTGPRWERTGRAIWGSAGAGPPG